MPVITRQLQFDAGHRVLRHESKCAHLHGHRYVAEITVSSPELDGLGRVVDFSVLKSVIGNWIDTFWDHNIILHPDDPLLKIPDEHWEAVFGKKDPYVMPPGANPTAENMASVLFTQCVTLLPSALMVEQVRLYETPNCWADCTDHPHRRRRQCP